MGAILSIQISAFTNKKILPSPENISSLMPKLKDISGFDFLPNVVNTQKFDISSGTVENVPNLSFLTVDRKNRVLCMDGRIDCLFKFELDAQDTVSDCFVASSEILKYLMSREDVFANRLALNVNFLSNPCDGESEFETQVMHIVPFYQNKTIKEWSSRTNAEGVMQISSRDEKLNIITEYTHAKEASSGETRIVCHSDINTLAENKDYRFTSEMICEFMDQAKNIFYDIQSDLERLVV